MAILIGTDEAGYGPNFGPLVISATRWRVPERLLAKDLYEVLSNVVAREPDAEGRLAIADSKALYQPGKGLGCLERSVLAIAHAVGHRIVDWRQAWELLAPNSCREIGQLPWYAGYERALPTAADREEVAAAGDRAASGLAESEAALERMEAVAVFPRHFNQLIEALGSKGEALSKQTLQLAGRMMDDSDEPVLVQCDKHGGRNRYGALLQHQFPDHFIEVIEESRPISIYRWKQAGRQIEFRFVAKGESFLPAALGSMLSKYLRELAMEAFNSFWKGHLPNIKPTAGYPVDASRFRKQIRDVQTELGIADQVLWRNR